MRRLLAGTAVLAAAAGVLLRAGALGGARRSVAEAYARFRRSSSPSVRLYDLATGLAMGGLYGQIADDLRLEAPKAKRILDVGCGPGRLLVEIADRFPEAQITGVDLDPAMVDRARERTAALPSGARVELVVADAAHLPFTAGTFDLVVSSFSLHHWGGEQAGMDEVARVLADRGEAILYDVPGWFGRLEGNAGIDRAVAVAPFAQKSLERLPWPARLSLVQRARLR